MNIRKIDLAVISDMRIKSEHIFLDCVRTYGEGFPRIKPLV